MHITLKAGEKLYLNGAVLRADRKVSLELMNDATFLLEAHVMQPQTATTPLRQLYFIVQTMLMSPNEVGVARRLFDETLSRMLAAYDDRAVLDAMASTRGLVERARYFEALKLLRGLFSRDDVLMRGASEAIGAGGVGAAAYAFRLNAATASPSPLWGRDRDGGCGRAVRSCFLANFQQVARTPTPSPSPQGGGETPRQPRDSCAP